MLCSSLYQAVFTVSIATIVLAVHFTSASPVPNPEVSAEEDLIIPKNVTLLMYNTENGYVAGTYISQNNCQMGPAGPKAKDPWGYSLMFGNSTTMQQCNYASEKECFKAKEEGHPSGQCDTYPRATRQPSPDPTHRALPVYQAVVNFYTEGGSNNVWLNATKTPISEDTCDKNEKTEKTGYDFSMNKCSTMPNESVQFHLDGEMAVYSFFSKPKCQGIPQFIASMLNNQCTKAITIPIKGLAPTFYAPFYSFDYPQ